VIKKNIYLMMK